ncbi:MAG: hypothetical protein ACXWP4_05410 [Polyangiales bacterium]
MRSLSLLFVLLAVGCGSRTLDDLAFADGDGGTDTGASASDTGGGAADGSTIEPGSDSGTIEPGSDGGTTIEGGTTVEAGVTDTGTTTGAPIKCGTTSCNSATEECCVTGSMSGVSSTCEKKGSCMGDLTLSCSDGTACAKGLVCCLTVDMSGGTSTCAKSCMSAGGPGGGSFVLCSSDAECPMGQTCRNSRVPGIKICQPSTGPGGGGGGGAGG